MTRKIIWVIMIVSLLVFCGCDKEEKDKNANQAERKTMLPIEDQLTIGIGYATNSNNYWRDELGRQRNDIDTIVNWLKRIDYCDSISFYKSDLSTLPDDQETMTKIQNENNYETIKEIIIKNEYDIVNNWFSDRRIIILHQFDIGKVHGNYCLVYAEGEIEESEKKYYKIVDKNYYSEVIFYE